MHNDLGEPRLITKSNIIQARTVDASFMYKRVYIDLANKY